MRKYEELLALRVAITELRKCEEEHTATILHLSKMLDEFEEPCNEALNQEYLEHEYKGGCL